LSKNQEAKKTQGIAYKGFLPQKSGSSIVTPGSTIADIQSQVEDLGNKILAAAETPAEVITSLVTKLVTKTIRQGIGQVQQKVQREINSATSNFSKQIKSSSQMNPGQLYKPKY
jgi:signal transduction histidine kinase